MEYNREPRNNHAHIHSINIWQGAKIQNREKDSSINVGRTGQPHAEKMKLDPYLIPFTKNK